MGREGDRDILIINDDPLEESMVRYIEALAEASGHRTGVLGYEEALDYISGHVGLRCVIVYCNEKYDQTERRIGGIRGTGADLNICVISPMPLSAHAERLREIGGRKLLITDPSLTSIRDHFESLLLNPN